MILLGLSAYFYQPRFIDNFYGFYLFVLSLPFIRLSFPVLPNSTPATASDSILVATDNIRWVWVGLAVLCMTLLTMMNARNVSLIAISASTHIQMLLLSMGLIALIVGFGGRIVLQRFTWKRHHWVLLGIVVLAGAIRFWNLEHTIFKFVDELLIVHGVLWIEQHDSLKILLPQANPFTDVLSYVQFWVRQIMGTGLTPLRVTVGMIGLAGIIGIYALMRQMYSVRIALLSAFLVAVMPAHIHFSRIGLNNLTSGMIATWCFCYMLRAIGDANARDFAIAGVLLGLTHYFYEAGRLFFTPFFVLWLIWIVLFNRQFQRPSRKHLAILIFCFMVVAAPFYITLISHGHPITQRLEQTRAPQFILAERLTEFLLDNQIGHLGAPIARYVQYPPSDSFYQTTTAFVLPNLVPFFLLGLGILFWRLSTKRGALLFWWTIGIAIANSFILIEFSSISTRHAPVYLILMAIVALGIDTIWSVLEELHKRLRKVVYVAFLIFCVGIGVDGVVYYFQVNVPAFYKHAYTTAASSGGRLLPAVDDAMLRAVHLPPNTILHVFTDALFSVSLRDEVPQYFGRDINEFEVSHVFVDDLTPAYFASLPRDRNHVFTFTPFYDDLLPMIERFFVITQIEGSPYDIPHEVEMIFYHAPLEANQMRPNEVKHLP